MKLVFLLFLVFLFIFGCVEGQQKQYFCADGSNNSEGCPSDEVYIILEEEDGLKWIGFCNYLNETKEVYYVIDYGTNTSGFYREMAEPNFYKNRTQERCGRKTIHFKIEGMGITTINNVTPSKYE